MRSQQFGCNRCRTPSDLEDDAAPDTMVRNARTMAPALKLVVDPSIGEDEGLSVGHWLDTLHGLFFLA
jgi:hypothetical protein